jgi:hypothetical protein
VTLFLCRLSKTGFGGTRSYTCLYSCKLLQHFWKIIVGFCLRIIMHGRSLQNTYLFTFLVVKKIGCVRPYAFTFTFVSRNYIPCHNKHTAVLLGLKSKSCRKKGLFFLFMLNDLTRCVKKVQTIAAKANDKESNLNRTTEGHKNFEMCKIEVSEELFHQCIGLKSVNKAF